VLGAVSPRLKWATLAVAVMACDHGETGAVRGVGESCN